MMKNIFSFDSNFSNFMNALASVLLLGILWLITSVPVITLGAASCAAYDVTVNVIRKGRGYVISSYFESFKTNFFVSLPVQIISILVFGLLAFDCIYLYGYGTEFSSMLLIVLFVFALVIMMVCIYIYPVMQRFDEPAFEIVKLAFYITFRHFLTTIILLTLLCLAVAGIYYMPWSLLIIPGLWWLLQSIFIEKILRRFSTVEDEDDTEFLDDDDDMESLDDEDVEAMLADDDLDEDVEAMLADDDLESEGDNGHVQYMGNGRSDKNGNSSSGASVTSASALDASSSGASVAQGESNGNEKIVVVKRRRLKNVFARKKEEGRTKENGGIRAGKEADRTKENAGLHSTKDVESLVTIEKEEGFKDKIVRKE